MFKNPFSFAGRISRKEYCITIFVALLIFYTTANYADSFIHGDLFYQFILLGYIWLRLSQGTKRSHDLNCSGLYQLIPFFGFALLFGEKVNINNKYGEDPRAIKKKVWKPIFPFWRNDNITSLVKSILPFSILNSIFIIICFWQIDSSWAKNLCVLLSILFSYLIMLHLHQNAFKNSNYKWVFSILLFIAMKIYGFLFLHYTYSWTSGLISIILLIIPISLAYFADYIFNYFHRKPIIKRLHKPYFVSIILIIIYSLIGLNNGVKKNIIWERDVLTWKDFKETDNMNKKYDAEILSYIKIQGDFTAPDFSIFAFMNPNHSKRRHDSLINEQLLIHEKYHFHISEYHARLLRKKIIGIGKYNLTQKVLDSLFSKQMQHWDKMQDLYDTETAHNANSEKQRYWEIKIDGLLRDTELYKDIFLNNYHLYNPKKTDFFKSIEQAHNSEILCAYPVNKANSLLGKIYKVKKHKDSVIVTYYENGITSNKGFFSTPIYKIERRPDTIIKHFLNEDRSYNETLKYQIEITVNNNPKTTTTTQYTAKKTSLGYSISEKVDNHTFLESFFNSNHQAKTNDNGAYYIRRKTDSLQRIISVEYLNKDSTLTLSKKSLVSSYQYSYDTNHNLVQKKLWNALGKPAKHKDDYNIRFKYDDFGNVIEAISLDEKNNKIEDKNGVSIYKYNYDTFGNLIQIKRYNRSKTPVLGIGDYFKYVEDYDKQNRICFSAYYYFNNSLKFDDDTKWGATKYEYIGDSIKLKHNLDAYNTPFNDDTNTGIIKHLLDKRKQPRKIVYLDIYKYFAKTTDDIVQYIYKYDTNGNKIEQTTLDSLGNKIAFSEDIATIKWEYKNNLKIKTSNYNALDSLADANNSGTFTNYTYTQKKKISNYTYFHKDKTPTTVNGIHHEKHIYNRFGKDSIVQYFDTSNQLIEGISSIHYKYNDYGSLIEETYYNAKNKVTFDENNVQIKRYLLNARQQNVGYAYYNENLQKAENKFGIHYEKIDINNYGYITVNTYYNKHNKPAIDQDGFHKIVSTKNSLGEEISYATFNKSLQPKENQYGIASYTYKRANTGLIERIRRFDKNGKLTNNENGVAETIYQPYLNGLYYTKEQKDKDGKSIEIK